MSQKFIMALSRGCSQFRARDSRSLAVLVQIKAFPKNNRYLTQETRLSGRPRAPTEQHLVSPANLRGLDSSASKGS